jgi:hypothetical protein
MRTRQAPVWIGFRLRRGQVGLSQLPSQLARLWSFNIFERRAVGSGGPTRARAPALGSAPLRRLRLLS